MRKFLQLSLLGGSSAHIQSRYLNEDAAAPQEPTLNIIDKTEAANFLRHQRNQQLLRKGRGNAGLGEEIFQTSNFQVECVEELCDKEELREVFPEEDKVRYTDHYNQLYRQCYLTPGCDARGTDVCIQYYNKRICSCKEATDNGAQLFDGDNCENKIELCTQAPCDADKNETCNSKLDTEDPDFLARGFRCDCKNGFRRPGEDATAACEDIDECQEIDSNGNPYCPADRATCENSAPGFSCICNDGYEESPDLTTGATICNDENECESGNFFCPAEQECENLDITLGGAGFQCVCKAGYRAGLDGGCEDVDECMLDENKCPDPRTTCENTFGGYECNPNPGYCYIDDSTELTDCEECFVMNNILGGETYNTDLTKSEQIILNALGFDPDTNTMKFGCDPDSDTPKCKELSAEDGGFVCTDACGLLDCGLHEVCYTDDSAGTATCGCEFGFERKAGGFCEDTDECIDDALNVCQNGTCVNTMGFYKCICDEGYTNENDINCILDDPCKTGNGGCLENQSCFKGGDNLAVCCGNWQVLSAEGVCVDDVGTCAEMVCSDDVLEWEQNYPEHCSLTKSRCDSDICGKDFCNDDQICLTWDGISVCGNPDQPDLKNGFSLKNFDTCEDGFAMAWSDHGCYDVDECQVNNGGCEHRCMNFYGTRYCYEDVAEGRKFCHHFPIQAADNADLGGWKCDCFKTYGICNDDFSCVSDRWNSTTISIDDLLEQQENYMEVDACNVGQISFGDKCYQQSNTKEKAGKNSDVLKSNCAKFGGELAGVDSRQLWWVLGNSIKSQASTEGVDTIFINPDTTDGDASNMVVLGEVSEDTDAMVANLARDMGIVPPSFNYVSNALSHFYFCAYEAFSGRGHPTLEVNPDDGEIGSGMLVSFESEEPDVVASELPEFEDDAESVEFDEGDFSNEAEDPASPMMKMDN